jgi:fructose-bisphosphate aldolase class II
MASAIFAPSPQGLQELVPAGVVTGANLMKLMAYCKEHAFALPAVNVTSSSSINGVLEAARLARSPVIIQFSNGGAAFMAGKGAPLKGQAGAVAGAVAGALHVRAMARHYGVPVVLHTDHCAHKLLPWLDGMLEENERHFAQTGEPLFSSHMIDLSEESLAENIATSVKYMQRCAKVNILLEVELGITGGEEDGVDNSQADKSKLYTQPEEVWAMYEALAQVGSMFSIASSFGNTHGVYSPGNVVLKPELLAQFQAYVRAKLQCADKNPVYFVFHGGSGSTREEIRTALRAGCVKMNIDTDLQWAYWDGVRAFEKDNRAYLQGQLGNPKGQDKPNKKYYDPRVWVRKAEQTMVQRLLVSFDDLQATGSLGQVAKL